jgi:hypothetical protein
VNRNKRNLEYLKPQVSKIHIFIFSVSVVRGLVSLLHGCQVTFTTNNLAEIEELLDLLGIALSDRVDNLELLLRTRRSRKRRLNNDEDDVVITFDKKNIKKAKISDLIKVGVREVSPKDLELKKRRVNYHTKTYTDWSKVAADRVVVKEEPVDDIRTPIPIIKRVTYEKKSESPEVKEKLDSKDGLEVGGYATPYRLRNRSGSGSLMDESELVVDLSYKRKRRSSGKSDVSKSSNSSQSVAKETDVHNSYKSEMTVSEQVVSETPLVIEESVEYTMDKQIVIDQE